MVTRCHTLYHSLSFIDDFQYHMTELKCLKEVFIFKGNGQFIFLCNPQKSLVNVCLIKLLKKHYHQKSNYVFL